MRNKISLVIKLIYLMSVFAVRLNAQELYHELYRPQIHFSPKGNWINDPNGMFFYKGVYHLFFQYFPHGTTWGPMHWGHSISKDLINWQEEPISLYPDSLGYIFSGSAVVDFNNTSGFGKNGQTPIVAIFTQHNPKLQKANRIDFENQSIAYSLDEGKNWTKFEGNPVLKNPGIKDFRDPKVMWYEHEKKWIMTLATFDRVTFYSSPDLRKWEMESQFGNKVGAHGGVWECPDLFSLTDNGKIFWVLTVNLNPGGPNSGSATQYFIGDFDGKKFTPFSTETKWMDYGPDEYAGVTWSNTGNRKIFLGWMSNWMYANQVPTVKWRNAMTLPRELKIKHIGQEMYVASQPVRELNKIQTDYKIAKDLKVEGNFDLTVLTKKDTVPGIVKLSLEEIKNFSLVISNDLKEQLIIGFNKKTNQYFIDRTTSGKTDFHKSFAAKHFAPRLSNNQKMDVTIIFDNSSVELFADDGLTVMTEILFPGKPYSKIDIQTNESVLFKKIEFAKLKSIWF